MQFLKPISAEFLEKPLQTRLLILGGLILSVVVLKVFQKAFLGPLSGLPGPFYSRFTRLGLKINIIRARRTPYIHALHMKYGSIVRISPNEVAISDVEAFQTIHRLSGGYNKALLYEQLNSHPNPGLFHMITNEEHAIRRKQFALSFSKTSILAYESIVREYIDLTISKIKRDAQQGNADILKWFTFMATDVIGRLSFGRSFGLLEHEKIIPYIRDSEIITQVFAVRTEFGFLKPLSKILPIKKFKESEGLSQRLHSYGMEAIETHKLHVLGNPQVSSLFSKFMDPKNAQGLSTSDIAAEASNFTNAGSHTTSVSLTYILWTLLRPRNKEIKQKLLQEIYSLPADTSAKDLMDCDYMKRVIDECLRLYSAAPGSLPRTVPPSGARFNGYYIPGGITVSTQAFTMHKDPTIFTNPEKFDPDRWINPTPKMKAAYHPFGAGSRGCIGIHLGMLELVLGVFLFFRACPSAVLAPTTTDESMEVNSHFLIKPKSRKCEITLPNKE